MVIVAWSPSSSITSIFDPDVFESVLSIFITAAFLNFLGGTVQSNLFFKSVNNLL